jgi:hypothetical protein
MRCLFTHHKRSKLGGFVFSKNVERSTLSTIELESGRAALGNKNDDVGIWRN